MQVNPITNEDFAKAFAALGEFAAGDIFAVGVSGGADSMALLRLLHAKVGKNIVAFTVEHGLRPESMSEAEWVHKECEKLGIHHHILRWEGDKPKTRIEEKARDARYDLLFNACREHGCRYLCLAHNLGDNVETFLMRLGKASGVEGLASIREVSERGGITILRPMLSFSRERIAATNKALKQKWVDDPSNWSDEFERVRWRKFLPELAKMGLTAEAIAGAIKKQREVADFLEEICDDFRLEFSYISPMGFGKINKEAFVILPDEHAIRILRNMLWKIGDAGYPPSPFSLRTLTRKIKEGKIGGGVTLHGVKVMIKDKGRSILLVREEARAADKILLSGKEKSVIFDRFRLSFKGKIPAGVWVQKLGHGFKCDDATLPKQALWTIPALWDKDGVLIVPHLGYKRENSATELSVEATMIGKQK